jgi:molecular chaperone GrpE
MNDSTSPLESIRPPLGGNGSPPDDVPQFGAVDIVEAFTALRHEYRGQTKESRALAEQIQAAVTNIQTLESTLLACVTEARGSGKSSEETSEIKPLVLLIIDTDHQLSRAVSAIAHWEANQQQRAESNRKAVEHYFAGMNRLARWFARPLLTFIAEQHSSPEAPAENPAVEGLNLVLARLRRVMHEQGIERLDTLGRQFDAETMHAIGTVATSDFASGYVADQLSPAYRWQGRLLRFADVRVAQ